MDLGGAGANVPLEAVLFFLAQQPTFSHSVFFGNVILDVHDFFFLVAGCRFVVIAVPVLPVR